MTTRHSDQHSGTTIKHALSIIINYQQGGHHTSSQLARQRLRPVTGVPGLSPWQRLHQTSPINQAHITWRTYTRNLIIQETNLTRPQGDDRTPRGDHTCPTSTHKNALHWHQLNFFNHWLDIATRPGRWKSPGMGTGVGRYTAATAHQWAAILIKYNLSPV